MQLNFSKWIYFFDLETTGIKISKDRIVEISIIVLELDFFYDFLSVSFYGPMTKSISMFFIKLNRI